MDIRQIFAGIGLLILVYLLVANAKNTSQVMGSMSNALTQNIKALQGNYQGSKLMG